METITITTIENPDGGASQFAEEEYKLDDFNGMMISDRQQALNYRHRMSLPGYFSEWHVAGDPTLIIVRQGTLRLTLRNGDYRDFIAGDQFIARDFMKPGVEFDGSIHGHTAEVLGNSTLYAFHLKLDTL